MVEARVEYDYDAENEDELSLQVGDIITNIERKEDGWWEGHLRGKVGLFPSNFVKILNKDQAKQSLRSTKAYSNGVQLRSGNPLTKRKRRCRVVYSYTPVNDDELELEVNNVIEVLEEVEEGWWKGILHGQVGVFPSNFVVEIDDVDEATSDSKQVSTSGLTDNGELEIKPKPVRGVDLGIILDEKSIQLKPVQESLDRKNTIAPKKPPAPTPPVSNDAAPVLPPKPDTLLKFSSDADLQIARDNERDPEYSSFFVPPVNMQLRRSAPNVSWQIKEDANIHRCQSWIEAFNNSMNYTTEAFETYQASACDSQESIEIDLRVPLYLYENYLALAENHCNIFGSHESQTWTDDIVVNVRLPKVETCDQRSHIHFQNFYPFNAVEDDFNSEYGDPFDDVPYCYQYENEDDHNFIGMSLVTLENIYQPMEEDEYMPEVAAGHQEFVLKKIEKLKSKTDLLSSYPESVHSDKSPVVGAEKINFDGSDVHNKVNSRPLIGRHSDLMKRFFDRSLKTPVKLQTLFGSVEMDKSNNSQVLEQEFTGIGDVVITGINEYGFNEPVPIYENVAAGKEDTLEAVNNLLPSEVADKSVVHEYECKVQSKNSELPSFVKIIHTMSKHASEEQTDKFLLDMKNGDKRIRSSFRTTRSTANMDQFDLRTQMPSNSSTTDSSLDGVHNINDSFSWLLNLRDNEKQVLLELMNSFCNTNAEQSKQFEGKKNEINSENDFIKNEGHTPSASYSDKVQYCNLTFPENAYSELPCDPVKCNFSPEFDTEDRYDVDLPVDEYPDAAIKSELPSADSKVNHNICVGNRHVEETFCNSADCRKEVNKKQNYRNYDLTEFSPRLISGADQSDSVFNRKNKRVKDQTKQDHNSSVEIIAKKHSVISHKSENFEPDFSRNQQKRDCSTPAIKVKEAKNRTERKLRQNVSRTKAQRNSEEKRIIAFDQNHNTDSRNVNRNRRNTAANRHHSKRQPLNTNNLKTSNSAQKYTLRDNEVIRELSSETITCCGLRRKRNYHPIRFSIASNDSGYNEDQSYKLEANEELPNKLKGQGNEAKLCEDNKILSSFTLDNTAKKDCEIDLTYLTPAEKKDVMVMTQEIAFFDTQDKTIIPKENVEVQTDNVEDKISKNHSQELINVIKPSDEGNKSDSLLFSEDQTNKEIIIQLKENPCLEEQKLLPIDNKPLTQTTNISAGNYEQEVVSARNSNHLQKVYKELEASFTELAAFESSKPAEVLNILEDLEQRKIKPQTSKLKECIRYHKEYHIYPASVNMTPSRKTSYKSKSRGSEELKKKHNQSYGPFDEPCDVSGVVEESSCESDVDDNKSYGPFDDPCEFPNQSPDRREGKKTDRQRSIQHTREKSNAGHSTNSRAKTKSYDSNKMRSTIKSAASERVRSSFHEPSICTCQPVASSKRSAYSGPKEDASSKYSVLYENEEQESIISGEVENEYVVETEIGLFGELNLDLRNSPSVSSASCSECSPVKPYIIFYDEERKPERMKPLPAKCKRCCPNSHLKSKPALSKYSQTVKEEVESCSSGSICEICDPYEGFTEMTVVSTVVCPNSKQACFPGKICPKCQLPKVSENYSSLPEFSRPPKLDVCTFSCKDADTQTELNPVCVCYHSDDSDSSINSYEVAKITQGRNYTYQMLPPNYSDQMDESQISHKQHKSSLLQQHKNMQTAHHEHTRISQQKDLQMTRHKVSQSSQPKSIHFCQEKSIHFCQEKSIQTSEQSDVQFPEHKYTQTVDIPVRHYYIENSTIPAEVVTFGGYIDSDNSSLQMRECALSGNSNSIDQQMYIQNFKDFDQYPSGLIKTHLYRKNNETVQKELEVCTCDFRNTDTRKYNANRESDHQNFAYDIPNSKTRTAEHIGDVERKFSPQQKNNWLENKFPLESHGSNVGSCPSLSKLQQIFSSSDCDKGVISRFFEKHVTISVEYPDTCTFNKSVQTIDCGIQPQLKIMHEPPSNALSHPYEGVTTCTCKEKHDYDTFTNKNQCTEAVTYIQYSPRSSSSEYEISDHTYPSENRYYVDALYQCGYPLPELYHDQRNSPPHSSKFYQQEDPQIEQQHSRRDPPSHSASKFYQQGNPSIDLHHNVGEPPANSFRSPVSKRTQAPYSLCSECSKNEALKRTEEKSQSYPENENVPDKVFIVVNSKKKFKADKSTMVGISDIREIKPDLYICECKKCRLKSEKHQSNLNSNVQECTKERQNNDLADTYAYQQNADLISSPRKSSNIYTVQCSSPVSDGELSALAIKYMETSNDAEDSQKNRTKQIDCEVSSEELSTTSVLLNDDLNENFRQEALMLDHSNKKVQTLSQNAYCNQCQKEPCSCGQICLICFQLPCICKCSVCLCTPCICKKKHLKYVVDLQNHTKAVAVDSPKSIPVCEDAAVTLSPASGTKIKKHTKNHKCIIRQSRNKKCKKCLNGEERCEIEKLKNVLPDQSRKDDHEDTLSSPNSRSPREHTHQKDIFEKPKPEPWSSLKNWYQEDLNYLPNDNLLKITRSFSMSHLEDLRIGNNKEQKINETSCRNDINSIYSEKYEAVLGFPATFDLINIFGNFFDKLFQMYYGNCSCLDSLSFAQRQYDLRLERDKIIVDSSCTLQESSSNPTFKDSLHKICLASSVYEDLSNSLSPSRNMMSSRRYHRNLSSSDSIQNDRQEGSDQNSQGNNFNLPQLPIRKKEKGKTMHSKMSPSDKNFQVYHFTTPKSEKPTATLFDKFMTKFVGFYDKLKPLPNDICNQCKSVKDLNISKEPSKLVRKSSKGRKTNKCLNRLPKSRTTYYHGTIKANAKKLELSSDFDKTRENIASELVKQLFENLMEIVLVFDILRTSEGISDFQTFLSKRDNYELPNTSFNSTAVSSCIEQNENDFKYKHFEDIENKLLAQKPKRDVAPFVQQPQQKKNRSKIPLLKRKKNRANVSSTNESEKLLTVGANYSSLKSNSSRQSNSFKKTKAFTSKIPKLIRKISAKTQKDSKKECGLQSRHLPMNPNLLIDPQNLPFGSKECKSSQNSLRNENCYFEDVDSNDGRCEIAHRLLLLKKCHSMPSLTCRPLLLGSGIPTLDSFQENNFETLSKDLFLPSLRKSHSCGDAYPVVRESYQSCLESDTVLLSKSPHKSPQSDTGCLSDESIGCKKLYNKNSSTGSFKSEHLSGEKNMHFSDTGKISESIYPLKRKNSVPNFQIKKGCEGYNSEFIKSLGNSEITTEDFSIKDNSLSILELANCNTKPNYLSPKQCLNETKEMNSQKEVNRCSEAAKLQTDFIQNNFNLPEESESLNFEQFVSSDKNSYKNKHSVKFDDSNNQILFSEKLVDLKPIDPALHCDDFPTCEPSDTFGWLSKDRNNDSSCCFQNKPINQTLANKNDSVFKSFVRDCSSPRLQLNCLPEGSKSPKTFSENRISFIAAKNSSILNDENEKVNIENCFKVNDNNYDQQDNFHPICSLANGLHKKSSISYGQPGIAVCNDNDQTSSSVSENLQSQVQEVTRTSANLSKCEKYSVHNHQDPLELSYVPPYLSFSSETNERFYAGLDVDFTSSQCSKNLRSKSLDREMKKIDKWKTNSLPSPYRPESYLTYLAKKNLLSPTIRNLNAKYGLFKNLQQNTPEVSTNEFIRNETQAEVITNLKEKSDANRKNKSKILHTPPLKRSFSNDFIKRSIKILDFKKYSEQKLTHKDILSHSV